MLDKGDFVEAMSIIAETQKGSTQIDFAIYGDKTIERQYDLFLTEATSDTIDDLIDQGFVLEVYGGKLRIMRKE